MAQFGVHRNANPASREAYPLLLDVQSDLMADLRTRVVIPLCRLTAMNGAPVTTLMPVCAVAGEDYVVLTPQLAAIAERELGPAVESLAVHRDAIVAALDLLLTGV